MFTPAAEKMGVLEAGGANPESEGGKVCLSAVLASRPCSRACGSFHFRRRKFGVSHAELDYGECRKVT